jgi:hypothetical protein
VSEGEFSRGVPDYPNTDGWEVPMTGGAIFELDRLATSEFGGIDAEASVESQVRLRRGRFIGVFLSEFQGCPEWCGVVFGGFGEGGGGGSIGTVSFIWSPYLPLSWIHEPTDTGTS